MPGVVLSKHPGRTSIEHMARRQQRRSYCCPWGGGVLAENPLYLLQTVTVFPQRVF